MPRMRHMDRSTENGWLPPPTTVCQWAPVQHNRKRPNWPFLVSYEDGKAYINKAEKVSNYVQATAAGDALL